MRFDPDPRRLRHGRPRRLGLAASEPPPRRRATPTHRSPLAPIATLDGPAKASRRHPAPVSADARVRTVTLTYPPGGYSRRGTSTRASCWPWSSPDRSSAHALRASQRPSPLGRRSPRSARTTSPTNKSTAVLIITQIVPGDTRTPDSARTSRRRRPAAASPRPDVPPRKSPIPRTAAIGRRETGSGSPARLCCNQPVEQRAMSRAALAWRIAVRCSASGCCSTGRCG